MKTRVYALLGATFLGAGLIACAPAEAPADVDVAGEFHEVYSCEESCAGAPAQTIDGEVDMTLTADGATITRVDDDGTDWTGTFAGQTIEFSTSDGDYSEDSVFTIDETVDGVVQSFTLTSEYTFGDCAGTCTGTVVRE